MYPFSYYSPSTPRSSNFSLSTCSLLTTSSIRCANTLGPTRVNEGCVIRLTGSVCGHQLPTSSAECLKTTSNSPHSVSSASSVACYCCVYAAARTSECLCASCGQSTRISVTTSNRWCERTSFSASTHVVRNCKNPEYTRWFKYDRDKL
jgi:hypothetical protein